MATILPVSDLRNYNRVLENVSEGTPVYLTVNGRGKYIIRDIKDEEEIEKMKAMLTLLLKLHEGKEAGEKEGYITSEDVRDYINKKSL
ncbi:MAG: prevent-host-death protein [Bacilli bacterium]|nr:prevent-host-death protein [Bacilli bacterium]